MRFQRTPRYPFRRTRRKDLAAGQELRLEDRERLPLLAELIREEQPTVDAIMAERGRRWIEAEEEGPGAAATARMRGGDSPPCLLRAADGSSRRGTVAFIRPPLYIFSA